MKKVIYVYKNNSSIDNTYKIGKADQRSNQEGDVTVDEIGNVRISEQLTAATYGEYEIVQVYDISHVDSSTSVEHAIHEGIEERGFTRLTRSIKGVKEGSTEWFDFGSTEEGEALDVVKSLVEKYSGISGLKAFTPRAYQAYLKAQVLDLIWCNNKVIGAELAPRFGKTLWTLDLFKSLVEDFNYQYLILPAFVLSAHSSFQKELRSFKDFDKMLFISDKDEDFALKIRENKDKILVIATSLHTPEESFEKYNAVRELDKDKKVMFIDEADFGAHTDSSKVRIDLLDVDTKVLMTGTAIERAVAGYETPSTVQWSYMDMLLLKDGRHPILGKLSA